jgi:hypothetical protein
MKKIYNIIKVYIYKKKKYIKAKNFKKIKKIMQPMSLL